MTGPSPFGFSSIGSEGEENWRDILLSSVHILFHSSSLFFVSFLVFVVLVFTLLLRVTVA